MLLGVPVDSVIVQNGMHLLVRGYTGGHMVQEFHGPAVAMPVMKLANGLSGPDLEGGEEGRGPVAFVVMGPGFGLPRFHGPRGLRARQGLNLRLFVDRQDQGMFGRGHIKTDHIPYLLGEAGVVGQLELAATVGH